MLTCRHCCKNRVNRPRGLCWTCYYTPGVKEMYFTKRRPAFGFAPLGEPTQTRPGTPERLAVLEQRAKSGQRLYHPEDAML